MSLSNIQEDLTDEEPTNNFKNGDTIHFDYDEHDPVSNSTSKKKKKKKKSKSKKNAPTASQFEESAQAQVNELNDENYPASRVINQAPNGDVLINRINSRDLIANGVPRSSIWDNQTMEEQGKLRSFWKSLPESEQRSLVNIGKDDLLHQFKHQHKNHSASCKTCGHKMSDVELELESHYEKYFDSYYDGLFGSPAIEGVNSIPDVLFNNALTRRDENELDYEFNHMSLEDHPIPPSNTHSHIQSTSQLANHMNHYISQEDLHSDSSDGKLSFNMGAKQIDFDIAGEEELLNCTNELKRLYNNKDEFLSTISNHQLLRKIIEARDKISDDILQDNGKKFISMMEDLGSKRLLRSSNLSSKLNGEINPEDNDMLNQLQDAFHEGDHLNLDHDTEIDEEHDHEDIDEEDEIDEADLVNYSKESEEESDEEYDDEDEEEDEDEEDDENENESEYSEEQRLDEIRRFFLLQSAKVFYRKLKEAYEAKIAEERSQILIEELQQEEEAKKQRELKKVKQKEKLKEKKRVQQQAREQERLKKEEEARVKKEKLEREQEKNREEQRRRKDEMKRKKDEEKMKRIEEMKRKELENQKKEEARKKKEDDARKQKEELKKKKEEERLQKEFEMKEQERKQREEELLQRVELERREREEQERLLFGQGSILQRPLESLSVSNTPTPQGLHNPSLSSNGANHLLKQLYGTHTNPISNTSPKSDQANLITSNGLSPSPNSGLQNSSLFNASTGNATTRTNSPWSNSISLSQPPNQFGLFHNNENFLYNGSENSATAAPPVYGNGFLNEKPANVWNSSGSTIPLNNGTNSGSGLFGQPLASNGNGLPLTGANSRNGSIWGGSFSQQNWSSSLSNGNLTTSPFLRSSSIVSNPGMPAPGMTVSNLPGTTNGAPISSDIDQLRDVIYQAYLEVLTKDNINDGFATRLEVFEATKIMSGQPGLSLTAFLITCKSNAKYWYDFRYDDLGTVTHLKITSNFKNLSSTNNSNDNLFQSQYISPFSNANRLSTSGIWGP